MRRQFPAAGAFLLQPGSDAGDRFLQRGEKRRGVSAIHDPVVARQRHRHDPAHCWLRGELATQFRSVMRDVKSLDDYTNQQTNEMTFLLDATLGLINVEQNVIIKIFSVVAVFFMPPTLVSSIYGMNFEFIDAFKWKYGFAFSIAIMMLSSLGTLYFFRRRKWL